MKDSSGFSTKRGNSLEQDLDILLGDLCIHWGFCNSLTGADLIHKSEPLLPEQFGIAVLTAEGFPNPQLELQWLRSFKRLFVDRYGSSVSAATYVAPR